MTPSASLPEFSRPPLFEVIMGVLFDPPDGYQSIRTREVWSLFENRFPLVRELGPLAPQIETFGLQQPPSLNFEFIGAPPNPRYWFLSDHPSAELLQFQSDRFMHNWRKVGDQSNIYPRFEAISESFREEIEQLNDYFSSTYGRGLTIKQCEVCYINHIRPPKGRELPGEWLRYVNYTGEIDHFVSNFNRNIMDGPNPVGRAYCEANTAMDTTGKPLIALTLTARGRPASASVADALEFIKRGHEILVRLFDEVTTDSAHEHWGRTP